MNKEVMKIFAERARNLRESKNLSTRMMAEILEVTQPSVSYYENALHEPTLTVLYKYQDYFNVSLDFLIGETDDPTRRNRNVKESES